MRSLPALPCCLLFLEQPSCQIYLICRYCLESHCRLQLPELFIVSLFKRRFVAKLGSPCAVDMVKQEKDILLRIGIEAFAVSKLENDEDSDDESEVNDET